MRLTTPRLVLRPWRTEDRAPFAALNADPEVMRFFPATLSHEESNAFVDRIARLIDERGWGFWALERLEDATFMGFVGLHSPEELPFSPCTEIGWRLARPFWGQGYATEAGLACLDFAFNVLGEGRIVAFTSVHNTPSQAVMHRLGMKRDAFFEHPKLPPEHPLRPHVLFQIQNPRIKW